MLSLKLWNVIRPCLGVQAGTLKLKRLAQILKLDVPLSIMLALGGSIGYNIDNRTFSAEDFFVGRHRVLSIRSSMNGSIGIIIEILKSRTDSKTCSLIAS